MFHSNLSKTLTKLLAASKRDRFNFGSQVRCRAGVRPKDLFGFTAYVVTDCASRGDVSGTYHFYKSEDFSTFHAALSALTQEVAEAARVHPEYQYFRSLEFASAEKAHLYFRRNLDGQSWNEWLIEALHWDWRSHGVFVEEIFEAGTWFMSGEDQKKLHLLTNTINSPYA